MRVRAFVVIVGFVAPCCDKDGGEALGAVSEEMESCEPPVHDDSGPETIAVVVTNSRADWIWLEPFGNCDQTVDLGFEGLPDGWRAQNDGSTLCEHAIEPREGACDPLPVLGIAPGSFIELTIPARGVQLVELPPACTSDGAEESCVVRRPLPAGSYTVVGEVGSQCEGHDGPESDSPIVPCECEPGTDPCEGSGEVVDAERFEVPFDFPTDSIDVVL